MNSLTHSNGGSFSIPQVTNLLSGLLGSNSSNIDLKAISQLVSGLIGGSGNIDIAQTAQLVGGLIGGSSNVDIAQITQLVGSLIGGSSNIGIGVITDLVGKLIAGKADFGAIASNLTENLMPILASINPERSSVDMAQLSQALPTVVDSMTTLAAAFTQANQGNIPEILSTSTQPNYDTTSLPTSTPGLELDPPIVFG
jgi:hypothetical protein